MSVKAYLFWLMILLWFLNGCVIEKRHYSRGVYIHKRTCIAGAANSGTKEAKYMEVGMERLEKVNLNEALNIETTGTDELEVEVRSTPNDTQPILNSEKKDFIDQTPLSSVDGLCDKLVYIDGRVIEIKLVKINATEVIYTVCNDTTLIEQAVLKKDIAKIKYATGGETVFNKSKAEIKEIEDSDKFPVFPLLALLTFGIMMVFAALELIVPATILYVLSLAATVYGFILFKKFKRERGQKILRAMLAIHVLGIVILIAQLILILSGQV